MILALSGPTCIGKGYAKDTIMKYRSVRELRFFTTDKSVHEKNNEYLSENEFSKRVHDGELVLVQNKRGHKYAFSKKDLERDDGVYIIEISPELVKEARELSPNMVAIGMVAEPNSYKLLADRYAEKFNNVSRGDLKTVMDGIKADIISTRENYEYFNVLLLISKEYESKFETTVLGLYDALVK